MIKIFEGFFKNKYSNNLLEQIADVLKDMNLRVSNYGDFLEISEIQSIFGPVLILFCDNENLKIESDDKYGVYIPTNDKNKNVDLIKLSYMVGENYNLERMKIGNYEYIQIKPYDNREVTDDFLYEVIEFLGNK
jgi:hypothetical protein